MNPLEQAYQQSMHRVNVIGEAYNHELAQQAREPVLQALQWAQEAIIDEWYIGPSMDEM